VPESPERDGSNTAPDDRDASGKSNWGQIANYAQLGFMFPAATLIGWLIGAGLDKWLHTTWLYIVGLLLGIAAGFVELIRMVSKNK
jgi:F0F1-type ATP synthase assembly protein I